MELKCRRISTVYIIDVIGEMDLYNAYKLKDVINKMAAKNITKFVINLQDVDYIDSSGIGALINVHSTLKKQKLLLRIVNVHGSVKRVIELTKLMGYFPIVNGLETAVKELQEQD